MYMLMMLMRCEEGRKKEPRKVIQTTKQHNTPNVYMHIDVVGYIHVYKRSGTELCNSVSVCVHTDDYRVGFFPSTTLCTLLLYM